MSDMIKKSAIAMMCSAIIAIILGFIMVAKPDLALETVAKIIACYIILHGILLIILDYKVRKYYYMALEGLVPGILSIALGVILIGKPEILSTIFGVAIGIWIMVSSIDTIRMAVAIKKENAPWLILLITGILDLIISIVIIFNPFEAAISAVMFTGIMLIIHSVFRIANMIALKKNTKEIMEIIKAELKEAE